MGDIQDGNGYRYKMLGMRQEGNGPKEKNRKKHRNLLKSRRENDDNSETVNNNKITD